MSTMFDTGIIQESSMDSEDSKSRLEDANEFQIRVKMETQDTTQLSEAHGNPISHSSNSSYTFKSENGDLLISTGDETTKDFNSSSETYISDDEHRGADGISQKENINNASWKTNFENDDPAVLEKTVHRSREEMNEEMDYDHTDEHTENSIPDSQLNNHPSSSPNKSIMKRSNSTSPRKSVVFTNDNPQIHHYPDTHNSNSNDGNSYKDDDALTSQLSHEWNDLASKSSSDDESSTPPAPPPHSSHTFTSIIDVQSSDDDNEIYHASLKDIRSKQMKASNLSLNEKLDIYLAEKNQGELDLHLADLEEAMKHKVTYNINNLSFGLQNVQMEEDPLLSLSKNSDVQLRSSGSSSSSLQSLRQSNRTLESINSSIKKEGFQFNGGLQGLPESYIDSIIPAANLTKDPSSQFSVQNGGDAGSYLQLPDLDMFNDSFNDNTEQIIMNLLKSKSDPDLPNTKGGLIESPIKSSEDARLTNQTSHVKQENLLDGTWLCPDAEVESANEPSIKAEVGEDDCEFNAAAQIPNEPSENIASQEGGNQSLAQSMKNLSISNLKQEEAQKVVQVKDEQDEINLRMNKDDLKTNQDDEVRNGHLSHGSPFSLQNGDKNDESSDPHENSEESNHSAQFSLRFHMDSDWKLEDSNDGDREDNTEVTNLDQVVSNEELGVKHLSPAASTDSLQEYMDASNEFEKNFPTRPKINVAIDATSPPNEQEEIHQVFSKNVNETQNSLEKGNPESKQFDVLDTSSKSESQDILANSSNIAPSEELLLPSVDRVSSGFDEFKHHVSSALDYEESLSAEFEEEKKSNVDFISIWHSQKKQRQSLNNKIQKPTILDPLKPTSSKFNCPHPGRKITDVNVMSRKILGAGSDELDISAFLPELSQDSGFENQFKSLMDNDSTMSNSRTISNKIFPVNNVLKEIDTSINTESSHPFHIKKVRRYPSTSNSSFRKTSETRKLDPARIRANVNSQLQSRKSKFKVPSFEIKRSSSLLSPRDQYNDIFEDVSERPTIKGAGMKTLPSMDKADFQKILNVNDTANNDEGVKIKHNNQQGGPVLVESNEPQDVAFQASMYDMWSESCSSTEDNNSLIFEPYKTKKTLSPKKKAVREENGMEEFPYSLPGSYDSESPDKRIAVANQSFPEPDLEFIGSPNKDNAIFKTPPQVSDETNPPADIRTADDPVSTPRSASPILSQSASPHKSNGRIKIGSPIKLVKDGQSVKAVRVVPPKRNSSPLETSREIPPIEKPSFKTGVSEDHEEEASMVNIETNQNGTAQPKNDQVYLVNSKIRPPQKSGQESDSLEPETSHNKAMSTVSVPSQVFDKESRAPSICKQTSDTPMEPSNSKDVEKGKLFFKVKTLKNIQLPDIRSHQSNFTITLDNGIHSIRTPNFSMDSNLVPINKEFELTVGESLQFILTMKVNYGKPKGGLVEVKERKLVRPKGKLNRMFGSKNIVTTTKFVPTQAKDDWISKVAQDGSFARAYVDFSQYEQQSTGNLIKATLTCFNEWEAFYDSKMQKATKCTPYVIAQMECEMLYIPRSDEQEVLPTSIKAAYEVIYQMSMETDLSYEGYMDQEGGDCESWKRRFFKLHGTSLIAHSEFSHKTRAKINLAKVIEVIYVDKENLAQSSSNYRNFSDVLLMDQLIKLKFANGEIIDFGCSVKSERKQWIGIFEQIVYRNKLRHQPWVKWMMSQKTRTSYLSEDQNRHAYNKLL